MNMDTDTDMDTDMETNADTDMVLNKYIGTDIDTDDGHGYGLKHLDEDGHRHEREQQA